jgi:hypothetical protein
MLTKRDLAKEIARIQGEVISEVTDTGIGGYYERKRVELAKMRAIKDMDWDYDAKRQLEYLTDMVADTGD